MSQHTHPRLFPNPEDSELSKQLTQGFLTGNGNVKHTSITERKPQGFDQALGLRLTCCAVLQESRPSGFNFWIHTTKEEGPKSLLGLPFHELLIPGVATMARVPKGDPSPQLTQRLKHPCLARQRSPRPTGGEEGFWMSGGCRKVTAHQEMQCLPLTPP